MKTVLLYGPISHDKTAGGYDRMNGIIVDCFKNHSQIRMIEFPIVRINLKGLAKKLIYPLFFAFSIVRDQIMFKQYVTAFNPCMLHITSLSKIFLIREALLIYAARKKNIKVFFDIRAGSFIRIYERKFFYRQLYRYCLKHAARVFVEGKVYQKFLKSIRVKSDYFPNYAKPVNPRPPHRYVESRGPFVFVYTGRVISEKGIEDSIMLLLRLKNDYHYHMQFLIIGSYEPQYRDYLYRKYSGCESLVVFMGYKKYDEIIDCLQHADFFMFLSSWRGEGHANAINEAMSCGLPIFYYDTGFTRDVIENDNFMLKQGDLHNNILKIKRMLDNPQLWEKESKRLAALVNEKYSLRKLERQLVKTYLNQ